jgi:hypothetical protein
MVVSRSQERNPRPKIKDKETGNMKNENERRGLCQMVYMEDGWQTRDGHHERHSLEEVGWLL